MNDLKYWVWLSSLPGIGSRRFQQLVQYFGSPINVWNASKDQLEGISGLEGSISVILDDKFRKDVDVYMDKIKELGIQVLRMVDDRYPFKLKAIYDPPPVLYIKGKLEKSDEKAIAIVGSRKTTDYGRNMARELAYELALRGITVVSGMARGIDTCAHRGAIEAGGRTIAVLGSGLDKPYPPENERLMEIISTSGAVISEFIVGTNPLPLNFPARNRIISGLSMGVVVIEAGEKSGALITADFALEQGREVFAVPGNVNSPTSKGTNKLIKEGAKMVTCVEDILEEFEEFKAVKLSSKESGIRVDDLSDEERKVIEVIGVEPLHIDIILRETGYNIQEISSLLTILETKGILKQLPGKFFVRT